MGNSAFFASLKINKTEKSFILRGCTNLTAALQLVYNQNNTSWFKLYTDFRLATEINQKLAFESFGFEKVLACKLIPKTMPNLWDQLQTRIWSQITKNKQILTLASGIDVGPTFINYGFFSRP